MSINFDFSDDFIVVNPHVANQDKQDKESSKAAINPDWLYSDDIIVHALPGWYNDPQKSWYVEVTSPDTKQIIVTLNGNQVITLPVRNGAIEWTPVRPLSDGEYSLSFTPVDFAGNIGTPVTVAYNVDTIPPAQPAIIAIEDDVAGGVQNGESIKRNGYTNDPNPVVRGNAEANSIVYIYNKNNKTPLASVKANARGEWEVEVNLPKDGNYELSAVAVDRADNRSPSSQKWNFELDTLNPDNAVIKYYQDDVGLNRGQFDFTKATDDRRPELHGSGEPGEYVRVQYAGKNGSWITTATVNVDSNGNWQWTPPVDLADGSWNFRVRSIDHAGNVSKWSGTTTLVVDGSTTQPTIVQAWDDVGKQQGNIASGQTTDDTRLDFRGKAEAYSSVTLYQDGVPAGIAQANGAGDWVITPNRDMREGYNNFTVEAVDTAGNKSIPSQNYSVNYKSVPKYERNSEDWELRSNDNWATGQTYQYGKLKVTELKHGDAINTFHTGIMSNIKTHTDYYHGRAVTMLDNSIVKYDFGETDFVAFNYANLHNSNAKVKVYSPDGTLLAIQALAQSGTINYESQSYQFNYKASAEKPIGYIEVHSAADPDTYCYYWFYGWVKTYNDVGWTIDTMTWGSGEGTGVKSIASNEAAPIYAPAAGELHIIDVASWLITTQPIDAIQTGKLVFDGAEQHIDFSDIVERIEGLQQVDITGQGNNTLKLDLTALLTEGGNGLFINDGTQQLMIDGDRGDRVIIDQAEWREGWSISQNNVQVGGESWKLITNSKENYTLLVNQEIELAYG
ncbi:Ig-like domain-containing protein [Enterobacter ludwigii]